MWWVCPETDSVAVLEGRKLKAQVISMDDAYFPQTTVTCVTISLISYSHLQILFGYVTKEDLYKPEMSTLDQS